MTQALYRKWRPARFADVVGQEHVTRTLQNAVAAGRVGHAFLFSGPRGTGKTTSARLLAKAVNCLHEDPTERPDDSCRVCRAIGEGRFLDLIEIDAASNTGVDDIRDLRDKINFAPNEGRFKVYIIDEVHMLSIAAFNALLKTLEEPPPHAKFVLATTEEHKVPVTIKSRCQVFQFRLLTMAEIVSRLEWLAEQEDLTVEPEALTMIARQGAGSLRDAESLLDQLVTAPGDTITLERAQKVLGTASSAAVAALTNAWIDGDGAAGLRVIHEALGLGTDARQFARQMVAYLRQLLLVQAAGSAIDLEMPAEQQAIIQQQARRASRPGLIAAVKAFNEAAMAGTTSWQPQLPLELAFIQLLPAFSDTPVYAGSPTLPHSAPPVAKPPPESGQPVAARPAAAAPEPAPTAEPEAEPARPIARRRSRPSRPQPEPTPPQVEAAPAPEGEREEASPPQIEQPLRAETQSATRPAAQGFALSDVTARWRDLTIRVGQKDRNLRALLAACKPLGVEGQTLVLGFEFDILREKFDNKGDARLLVSQALSELLGMSCQVRTVLSGSYTPPAPTISPDEFTAFADEIGGVVEGE